MIKKSISRILIVLIFIGFSWAGFSAIDKTFSYFSDTENSNGNIYQAGILDLSLRSSQGNFVPNAQNIQSGNQVNRDIYIGKTSVSSPLQYKVSYELIGGNEDFCNQLQLKIWYDHYNGPVSGGYDNRDMKLKYNGQLTSLADLIDEDFIIPHPDDQFDVDSSDGTEQWFYYSIVLPSSIAEIYQGQVCNFNFVVKAWQDNIGNYGDGGFTDIERLENTIKVGYWNPSVVLNEFLPNAVNYPEFIEIYNNTSSPIDLSGFYIKANDKIIPINTTTTNAYSGGSTTILPNGWLVVTTGEDKINNSSGTITLYNGNDIVVDSYPYGNPDTNVDNTPGSANSFSSGSVPADKSYARIPDGSSNWVDPIPTPGAPNKLDEEDIEELQLEEIIEEIPLVITTTATSTIPDGDILENSTSTSITITKQTTTTTTIPETTTTTTTILPTTSIITSTISEIPEEPITPTTTTEPPIEEPTTTTTIIPENPTITTTTTTQPPVEELAITTTTIPGPPVVESTTTTTNIPEEPINMTTTTTTIISEQTTTTTTISETTTTTQPPMSTDSEPDDLTVINLINIYFV